jgi:Bacteriophage Mu Gam like protein
VEDIGMSSAFEDELDEFLDDAEAPDSWRTWVTAEAHPDRVEHPGPWTIPDDGAADWALRKLAKAQAARAEVQRLAKARMTKIQQWLYDVEAPLIHDEAHWGALLSEYALRRRKETGKPSVRLPNGTLGTTLRDKGGSVEIADVAALAAFLDARPEVEARWCKIDVEPQISRFKDEVEIRVGAICDRCGRLLLFGALPDMGSFWLSALNERLCRPDNPAPTELPPGGHHPKTDEAGEIEAHQVPVWVSPVIGSTIVPGLAVRAEKVTSKVTL